MNPSTTIIISFRNSALLRAKNRINFMPPSLKFSAFNNEFNTLLAGSQNCFQIEWKIWQIVIRCRPIPPKLVFSSFLLNWKLLHPFKGVWLGFPSFQSSKPQTSFFNTSTVMWTNLSAWMGWRKKSFNAAFVLRNQSGTSYFSKVVGKQHRPIANGLL